MSLTPALRRPLVRSRRSGHADRPRSRRHLLARSAAVLLLTPALALGSGLTSPASAAITGPTNGSTVSGNVAVTEGRGATSDCVSGGNGGSRLTITRAADGAVVHTASKGGTGSYSTTWSSLGQPRGDYVIRSYAKDGKKSGFLNLGCTTQAEALLSTVTVTLDNRAAVDVTVPASVVTGEELTVGVRTTVQATGVGDQVLGQRSVTISVPGVGSEQVTTDADGLGSATFDLPDLAAGPLEVSAEVADDASYRGLSGTATTTLAKRTTQTLYRGDSRGEPGSDAVLEGLLVDATPGSDRYGEPVVGEPLALAFGADTADVDTVASGRATRTVAVRGESRLVPVSATYAGDDVYLGSDDAISFFVGDDAATRPPVQSGQVGSTTTALNGLLGTTLSGLLGALTGVPVVGDLLTSTASSTGLQPLLTTLLGSTGYVVHHAGDPVDDALGGILDAVSASTPLGAIVDTARFEWRAVYVAPDGTRRAREFNAVIGVPQPLDVTGDSVADVLAVVRLAELTPDSVVPRIEVARLGNLDRPLPLSLQAVVDLPGSDATYRFGYDTRTSDAPESFAADVVVGSGGATLDVASEGEAALAVTGAIVPTSGPGEQRFGVTFSAAPPTARLGLDLASGAAGAQQVAAALHTDEPTRVGLSLVDDSGASEVFTADGALDSVDGDLAIVLNGTTEDGLSAELTSDGGLDRIDLRAQDLDGGRTVSDVRLALADVPDVVSFGLSASGAGELTASGPIGIFEAGYASGRPILLLDDPAYLRLLQAGSAQSVAVRLPGFEGMSLDLGDQLSLALTMAPTPLHALVNQDGRVLDATIADAPHQLTLALSPDGAVSVEGSDPIGEVNLSATDPAGILDGSSNLDLRLVDVPRLLSVEVTDDGVVFDTGGDPIGLLEVFADNGTHLAVPGDGDGLLLRTSPDGTALAARVSGLRTISASLGDEPDVLLDTVAGAVFTIKLLEVDETGATTSQVDATLDHLVPHMRLGLLDDGSGATKLTYSADEPTNSLSFAFGDLSGSIAGPLPQQLLVCMAGDEACLPDLGIENPGLGSVRFAASEPTTLNLNDATGGLSAQNLRLQVLDLTGTVDTDTGGDVYLNTTEFGGDCGTDGCIRPIEGGKVTANLGSAGLTFEPGNGFYAVDAITHLKVDKLFGQPIGLSGTGGTGQVHCVSATKVDVTVFDVPVFGDITLSVKDAICNVTRT